MPHEVIMPALGMAQDTGLIVAWHKAPGDAVAATDVLLEVETDKATMDVEAGHEGYVAALLAQAGEEAPVGAAIALISAEKPDNPIQTSIAAKAAPGPAATAAAEPAPAPAAEKKAPPTAQVQTASPARPARKPKAASMALDGRILASPKVRRLAAEQGLDLARLAALGIPMPYHVADLETLRSLPEPAPASGVGSTSLQVSARAPRSEFVAFSDWLEGRASVSAVWAAYAAASLRAAIGAEALIVRVDQPLLGKASLFTDPDQVPMSAVANADIEGDDLPSLIIRDVTDSRITGGNLGAGAVPALTVATNGDDYALTLDFAPGQLDAEAAAAFLDGFAARLEEPLRHLL